MSWAVKGLGLTQKQKDNYSFTRVMSAIANRESPSARKNAGFELDLSHQICKRDNRETPGAIIPQEILDNRYRSDRPIGGPIMTEPSAIRQSQAARHTIRQAHDDFRHGRERRISCRRRTAKSDYGTRREHAGTPKRARLHRSGRYGGFPGSGLPK